MRSDQSKTAIAFYSPEYRGSLHFFGCASLGFADGRNAETDLIRRFPVELEAMEISGSYDACMREVREAAGERKIRACIALTGNAGNENVFVASLGESLERPVWVPGYGQALVRIAIPMRQYMKEITTIGVTQHFSLCFGNIKPRLELLAAQLGIEYVDLDRR